MAATYKRVQAEVGSVRFYPLEAKYEISRGADETGRRTASPLVGRAHLWCDAGNTDSLSQEGQVELWRMATESEQPLHKVSITYYQEDGDKVLATVQFMGWVSVFQYTTPTNSSLQSQVSYKNLLYIKLTLVLDETNASQHKFTK
jgi:hypothetical protein